MAASSRLMIAEAERRFPVRIKLAIPTAGLGERLNQMHAWLDQNAGADGWSMTPSGARGVVNDAIAIYLAHRPRWRFWAGARVSVAATRSSAAVTRLAATRAVFPEERVVSDPERPFSQNADLRQVPD